MSWAMHGSPATTPVPLVGGTGYHLPKQGLEHSNAEIGMWIAAHEAGRGLGTRTLRALLDWGFSAWPWQRLFWRCDTRNLASARTAQKAGMILEGTFRSDGVHVDGTRRDTHLFARLRTEEGGIRQSSSTQT